MKLGKTIHEQIEKFNKESKSLKKKEKNKTQKFWVWRIIEWMEWGKNAIENINIRVDQAEEFVNQT